MSYLIQNILKQIGALLKKSKASRKSQINIYFFSFSKKGEKRRHWGQNPTPGILPQSQNI